MAQPGIDTQRDAQDDGNDDGREGQLQRRRHAFEDQAQRRAVVDERVPEIALKEIAEKDEVLFVKRSVEAKLGDQSGAFCLRGIGVDQDVHRTADREDPRKDQEGHHERQEQRLHQSADHIDQGTPAQPIHLSKGVRRRHRRKLLQRAGFRAILCHSLIILFAR
jgi:hypothetical protein